MENVATDTHNCHNSELQHIVSVVGSSVHWEMPRWGADVLIASLPFYESGNVDLFTEISPLPPRYFFPEPNVLLDVAEQDTDFSVTVSFNMQENTVYVKQRPHLYKFLERVVELFHIVIFTASHSIYASQLLDILDPGGKFVSQRFYRDSCILSDGIFAKDLTVLGFDLAKVAIVDNCPHVYRMQRDHGNPIKSWYDDPTDDGLIALLPFLESLADTNDVRPIIAKRSEVSKEPDNVTVSAETEVVTEAKNNGGKFSEAIPTSSTGKDLMEALRFFLVQCEKNGREDGTAATRPL